MSSQGWHQYIQTDPIHIVVQIICFFLDAKRPHQLRHSPFICAKMPDILDLRYCIWLFL